VNDYRSVTADGSDHEVVQKLAKSPVKYNKLCLEAVKLDERSSRR
jgi:hypothetical protein